MHRLSRTKAQNICMPLIRFLSTCLLRIHKEPTFQQLKSGFLNALITIGFEEPSFAGVVTKVPLDVNDGGTLIATAGSQVAKAADEIDIATRCGAESFILAG